VTRNLCAIALAALLVAGIATASTGATPGVSATTVTLGSSGPLTGEAAAAAGVLRGADGYFKYINARGGVNGRKIDFKYLDDAYDPSQTVQNVRQLIQQDNVFALFSVVGTNGNLAIRDYANAAGVPTVFSASGATTFGRDYVTYPWTIGYLPPYGEEGQLYAKHILATNGKKAKVAVLGTGVNPGFAMDALPIALTAVCERVERVIVNRVQDARMRRLPFQQKIGAGLTTEQFQKKVDDGSLRHVGMTESIAMIADALGWTLDRITDDIQPKLATVTISSEFLAVDPGYVCGIIQDGCGFRKKEPVIKLHMEAYLGSPETYDSIEIEGSPSLSMKIAGGIHGDVATASIVVNSIPKVLDAPPGLRTMRDLALPSFFPGR